MGEILRTEGPPTVEFRASIVIGEGSASFELIRTLVDTLPALVLPDWVETRAQPIAVDDVVAYLVEALEVEFDGPSVFEIGGADTVTYAELIQAYGDTVGKARPTITLPAFPLPVPDVVSSLAPEQARVWLKLVEGLRYDSTVRDPAAEKVFSVEPRGLREALADAVGAAERS